MAAFLAKSLRSSPHFSSCCWLSKSLASIVLSQNQGLSLLPPARTYAKASSSAPQNGGKKESESARVAVDREEDVVDVPTWGVSRPLSEILKELNKRVPDSLVKVRIEDHVSVKYIPWHIVNRIMNLHAPEWSGEVRNMTYSADGKSVSVVYRVTLYGTDGEMYRESTGTASVDDTGYGDPVQKAEAMAFRRACARFGLGLHLYHEDML